MGLVSTGVSTKSKVIKVSKELTKELHQTAQSNEGEQLTSENCHRYIPGCCKPIQPAQPAPVRAAAVAAAYHYSYVHNDTLAQVTSDSPQ